MIQIQLHNVLLGIVVAGVAIVAIEVTKAARVVFTELYRDFLCLRGKLPACGYPIGDVLTCELHNGHQYRYHQVTYNGKKLYRERADV